MSDALVLDGVEKSFGRTSVLKGVDLAVKTGTRQALIGPNGAGKSTLFHLISGRLAPTRGRIVIKGIETQGLRPHRIARLGVARGFQITNVFPRLSVFENIRCGALWSLGHRYDFLRPVDSFRGARERTEEILEMVGLHDQAERPAELLSYADRRTLEIGIAIAGGGDILLLDEPTAGMSAADTERTVELIRRVTAGRTLILVDHDMSVVFGLADRIAVLADGKLIANGSAEDVRASAEVRQAYLGGVGA